MTGIQQHYQRLAATFADHWTYTPAHLDWMTNTIAQHLQLTHTDTLADLGCGPGLYAHRLADHTHHVHCVDPNQAMLDQIPPHPRITRELTTAEHFATRPEPRRYDAILLKEVIHHLTDRDRVIHALARRLAPTGRLLVVMLPPAIDHPLFPQAHARYANATLKPSHITSQMQHAGLRTSHTTQQLRVRLPTTRYLDMIRNRYMSLLTAFTDAQLEHGIDHIRHEHPGDHIEFDDRYTFITATKQP